MNESLSLQEAATKAGTTVSALRQAIKRGRLTATIEDGKHGPTYTVLASEIESYVKGKQNRSQKVTVKGRNRHSTAIGSKDRSKDGGDTETATKAILEELRLLRVTVEQQAYKIGSLEQELHDTKSQLSSQLGMLQRALPATSKGWLERLFGKDKR